MIKYTCNYLDKWILAETIKAVTFSIKRSNMTFPIDMAGGLTFILCTVPRSFYASTKGEQWYSVVSILRQDSYTHMVFVKKHKTMLHIGLNFAASSLSDVHCT